MLRVRPAREYASTLRSGTTAEDGRPTFVISAFFVHPPQYLCYGGRAVNPGDTSPLIPLPVRGGEENSVFICGLTPVWRPGFRVRAAREDSSTLRSGTTAPVLRSSLLRRMERTGAPPFAPFGLYCDKRISCGSCFSWLRNGSGRRFHPSPGFQLHPALRDPDGQVREDGQFRSIEVDGPAGRPCLLWISGLRFPGFRR